MLGRRGGSRKIVQDFNETYQERFNIRHIVVSIPGDKSWFHTIGQGDEIKLG